MWTWSESFSVEGFGVEGRKGPHLQQHGGVLGVDGKNLQGHFVGLVFFKRARPPRFEGRKSTKINKSLQPDIDRERPVEQQCMTSAGVSM